jgi:Fic family protein
MIDSIFVPNFNITPDVQAWIEGVERNSWLIGNMLLMPKHEAWIRRDVSVQRAAGTTRIEGANMADEEVSELSKRSHVGKLSEDERANINAIQAYEFVDYLSDQPEIPLDELVIRELDRYFLGGAKPELTPGVYRKGENRVGEYIPPNQGDVPELMRAFAAWLQQESDEVHPIAKAGIAHIHLVAIHPFWDGNGRTARALATLILQRSRFNFKKLLSLEKFFSLGKDRYFSAIEGTLGARFSQGHDSTPWLSFFCNSLMAHSIELTQQLTDWHRRMNEIYQGLEKLEINHRQVDGLAYAVRTGRITRADYMEITDTSPVTASRDLARLVGEGFLQPVGKTRGRVYLYVARMTQPATEPPREQGRLFSEKPE